MDSMPRLDLFGPVGLADPPGEQAFIGDAESLVGMQMEIRTGMPLPYTSIFGRKS